MNLADGLVDLINAENVHAAPPVARALYETCAVATYMRRNLIPLLVNKRPARAKVMLFRLGLGNAAGAEWGKLKPYQVRAFVKSMAQEVDELAEQADVEHDGTETFGATMHRLYAELSELTHPNSMATMLSITIEMKKPPKWELRPRLDDAAVDGPLGTAHIAMYFGGLAWDEVVNTAQQHPLLLPREEEFGPHDLHDLPESTADADEAVDAGRPDARQSEGDP